MDLREVHCISGSVMSSINWNAAIQYALLVKIAEAVNPSGSYGNLEINQIKTAATPFCSRCMGTIWQPTSILTWARW